MDQVPHAHYFHQMEVKEECGGGSHVTYRVLMFLDCSLIAFYGMSPVCVKYFVHPEVLLCLWLALLLEGVKIQAVISLVRALPAGKVGDIRLDHRCSGMVSVFWRESG